jgi:hypothetical protein
MVEIEINGQEIHFYEFVHGLKSYVDQSICCNKLS